MHQGLDFCNRKSGGLRQLDHVDFLQDRLIVAAFSADAMTWREQPDPLIKANGRCRNPRTPSNFANAKHLHQKLLDMNCTSSPTLPKYGKTPSLSSTSSSVIDGLARLFITGGQGNGNKRDTDSSS